METIMGRLESEPRRFTRRDFVKFILGTMAGSVACRVSPSKEGPPTEPIPPKEPTPVPTPTREVVPTPTPKEIERGVLWTEGLYLPPKSPSDKLPEAFFATEDQLFLADVDGYPMAFNLTEKGDREWVWGWDDRGRVYGAEQGTVYLLREDQRLYALDARSGEQKWKAVFGVDNAYYTADWPLWICQETAHLPFWATGILSGFELVTIEKKTGNILWWHYESSIIAKTERTLVTQDDVGWGAWHGLDPVTGDEKWAIGLRGFASTFGQTSEDSVFYLLKTGGDYWSPEYSLAAVDVDSGEQTWQSEGRQIEEIFAVTSNRIYVRDSQNNLVAFEQETGDVLWTFPNVSYHGSTLLGEIIDGLAIITHENMGYTWGIDALSGRLLWENDDLRLNRLVGGVQETLVGVYNDPYFRNPPLLYGLDTFGQRKWRLELPDVTHKVIIFRDKLVYGSGANLAVLDPTTGQRLSSIPLPDSPKKLSPHEHFLLVQTGAPYYHQPGAGTLSAVRI